MVVTVRGLMIFLGISGTILCGGWTLLSAFAAGMSDGPPDQSSANFWGVVTIIFLALAIGSFFIPKG
jgi:hypothetical protein